MSSETKNTQKNACLSLSFILSLQCCFYTDVLVLLLICVALWLILRGDLYLVLPCVLYLCFFSPFSFATTSLGEVRALLRAFRAFVCFVRVGLCLLSFHLGVRDWLRLVIVTLSRRFLLPLNDCQSQIRITETTATATYWPRLFVSPGKYNRVLHFSFFKQCPFSNLFY